MAAKKSEQTSTSFFPALSKYDMKEVKIEDQGLARYINLDTENLYHGGINANKIFAKSKIPIIERLIN
ncbi:MAG: 30S ribosomal protein S7, partial [Thermoplasmatales archaeon]|nr:30S ribosomal protein S7 [Thermoplasmatales archaeon]